MHKYFLCSALTTSIWFISAVQKINRSHLRNQCPQASIQLLSPVDCVENDQCAPPTKGKFLMLLPHALRGHRISPPEPHPRLSALTRHFLEFFKTGLYTN